MFEPVTDTHEVNVMTQFVSSLWMGFGLCQCKYVSKSVIYLFKLFFFLHKLSLCEILLLYYKLLETVQQTVLNSIALYALQTGWFHPQGLYYEAVFRVSEVTSGYLGWQFPTRSYLQRRICWMVHQLVSNLCKRLRWLGKKAPPSQSVLLGNGRKCITITISADCQGITQDCKTYLRPNANRVAAESMRVKAVTHWKSKACE